MKIKTLNNIFCPKLYLPLIFVLILVAIPYITSNSYILHLIIMMLFYAVLSGAWNILGGFAGQFSLGHAAFFGLGAYTSTLLFISRKISPWLGMFVGGGFAVISSLIIGFLCFRLRGHFFSLVTIAFSEVLRLLFLNWSSLTGGPVGLLVPLLGNSPIYFQFSSRKPYYFILLVMLLILVFFSYKIRKSQMGLFFLSIREDEVAAQSLGINILKYKLIALSISVFFIAIAGTFYAQYILFLHPDSAMSLNFSVEIALPSIIGGMGTIWGPVVGSFILTPISEFIRALLGGGYAGVYLIIHGGILILTVLLVPSGVTEKIIKYYESVLKKMPGGRNH
jgi:branched-chain amino acid transport system permease protein